MQELEQLLSRYREDFSETLDQYPELQRLFDADAGLREQLERLWQGSDFAAELCCSQPALLQDLLEQGHLESDYPDWELHLQQTLPRLCPAPELPDVQNTLKRRLRLFRKREMLRILWRDLNGRADLLQTCRDLSLLADSCIHHALEELAPLCRELHGLPLDADGVEQQLIVLAMGKYGAYELNLSSDIDLIFVYPENGETRVDEEFRKQFPRARSCTMQQYFNKLGQLLVQVLDNPTADGQVFRVDMRLRPYGSAGALTLSVDAMEEYYQTQGRDWERFAMIKVRAVTGDPEPVQYLMSMLRSFSFRRYIDFATIDSLRSLKGQIEQQVRRKGMQQNLKLGRGGIREVEFVVQVLQLIYGGHHRYLQHNSLMRAMDGLVQAGSLPAEDAEKLRQSYLLLRRTEHAVQGLQDKQTHDYPQDAFDEQRVALALGMDSAEALRRAVDAARDTVSGIFSGVIAAPEDEEEAGQDSEMQQVWNATLDEEKAEAILQQRGFADAQALLGKLRAFHESRQFLSLDAVSRSRMDRFMPQLLARVAGEENPDLAFGRVFEFVQAVSRRTVYLVLLLENPLALSQLIMLCAASPWMVELLSRYPVLLDELLRPLSSPPAKAELRDGLRQALLRIAGNDTEEQLAAIQNFKQEQVLVTAAAELSGTLPLMKVSDSLSWVAEAVLEQVLDMAWELLSERYGLPANAEGQFGSRDFIIIGYGKLGGIELNYGSDLDLVFMHDGHPDLDTEGGSAGSINSGAFYVQLGQKILSMLNTHTISGRLYEIDMRLRPSGASGALVSTPEAFSRYQRESAWTWEHQALVRTRVVAGAEELARRFDEIRGSVLGTPRETAALAQDIVSMRERMRRQLGSGNSENLFHLKQDRGGLVDIEFIVQYLVLAHAAEQPALLRWSDNMRLLDTIAELGLLSPEDAEALQQAYIDFRSHLHKRALDNADYRLGGDEFAGRRETVTRIWHQLFEGIEPGPLREAGGTQ